MPDIFEKAFESRATEDPSGRLKRPIATAVTGCLISFCVGVLLLAKSGGRDIAPTGLIATFIIGSILSIAYAIIGAKKSKAAAHRFISIVGSLIALSGVIYIIYLVKSGPSF